MTPTDYDAAMAAARNAAYREGMLFAAQIVHAEARWQTELDQRGIVGAQTVAQRMTEVEKTIHSLVSTFAADGEPAGGRVFFGGDDERRLWTWECTHCSPAAFGDESTSAEASDALARHEVEKHRFPVGPAAQGRAETSGKLNVVACCDMEDHARSYNEGYAAGSAGEERARCAIEWLRQVVNAPLSRDTVLDIITDALDGPEVIAAAEETNETAPELTISPENASEQPEELRSVGLSGTCARCGAPITLPMSDPNNAEMSVCTSCEITVLRDGYQEARAQNERLRAAHQADVANLGRANVALAAQVGRVRAMAEAFRNGSSAAISPLLREIVQDMANDFLTALDSSETNERP